MQPTLNKIHSLDYSSSGGQRGNTSARRNTSGNNAHLMHSVSIVVELAKDSAQQHQPDPQGGNQILCDGPESDQQHKENGRKSCNKTLDSELDDNFQQQNKRDIDMVDDSSSNDSFNEHHSCARVISGSGSGSAAEAATVDHGATPASMSLDEEEDEDNEDDNDDEDDEDDGGCLSSDLARKVVIVDEADKILRSRAQSAEPLRLASEVAASLSCMLPPTCHLASGKLAGFEPQPSRVPPPIPARTMVPRKRLNTIAGLTMDATNEHATEDQKNLGGHASLLGMASSSGGSTCSSMTTSSDMSSAATTPSKAAAVPVVEARSWTRSGGGHGELAERGELSKMSMRRNTHHYVTTACSNSNQGPPVGPAVVTGTPGNPAAVGGSSIASGMRSPAANTKMMAMGQIQQSDNSIGWPNRPKQQHQHTRSGSAQLERGPLMQLARAGGYGAAGGGSGSLLARRTLACCESPTKQTTTVPAPSPAATAALIYANQHKPRITQNATTAALQQATNTKNWSQRRQSLQISLLTGNSGNGGGSGVASSTGNSLYSSQSKLLTEEELRGEREFNEQVRSAKSPEISALFAAAAGSSGSIGSSGYKQQAAVPGPAGVLSGGGSTVLGRRCHSVTGPIPSRVGGGAVSTTSGCTKLESSSSSLSTSASPTPTGISFCETDREAGKFSAAATATGTSKIGGQFHPHHQIVLHSIVKTHNNLQHLHQKSNQRHSSSSQRRVSFGSIDPILVRDQTVGSKTRASFAFQPPSSPHYNHNHHHHHHQLASNNPLQLDQSDDGHNNNNSNHYQSDVTGSDCDNDNNTITGATCLLSDKHSKRHSIASTTAANNPRSSTAGIHHSYQPTLSSPPSASFSNIDSYHHHHHHHQFMDPIGAGDSDNNKLASSEDHQDNISSSNNTYHSTSKPISTQLITTPTKKIAGIGGGAEVVGRLTEDNANMMAGPQDHVQLSLQENSDPVERQLESSSPFQTNMLRATNEDEEEQEEEEHQTTPAAPSNNWTVTSSTNTTTTMTTTPTNVPNKHQPPTGTNNNNNNNNGNNPSRVQSIMANAKLRQEEFARLLEEHEQIVNEINRVETKISNNSQINQLKQQPPTTTTTHRGQEGGGGE